MFKKILVVHCEKLSEKHVGTVARVKELLKGKDYKAVESKNLKKEDVDNSELVITIGGDGTFVRAASFIDKQYILGINSEPNFSEGALLSIKESELDFIKEILKGKKFNVLQRDRMVVKRNGKLIDLPVLSEVYVGTKYQFDTSRYIINYKGKKEEHRSSGVLIITESGSKAWYKSAGGKPFDERGKIKFLVREPYTGDRVFIPKILNGEIDKNESLFFESTRLDGGILALDANTTFPFNMGDKVEVMLSNNPLNVIIK